MTRSIALALAILLLLSCAEPNAPEPPHRLQNGSPVAAIEGPGVTTEGDAVTFSAERSTDPDGDPLRITWLPGDGRVLSDSSAPSRYTWQYQDNGTFTVSVIVRDPDGAADTATAIVMVRNAPPVIAAVTPPPQSIAGRPAFTNVTFSDPGAVDTHTLTIYWGDGSRDSIYEPGPSSEPRVDSMAHAFTTPGSYSIRAMIRDKDGDTTTTVASPLRVLDPAVADYQAIDIGTLGGSWARPFDFNDYGQIVGSSATASGLGHAFVWENGVMRDLDAMGYARSEAQRVNNAGVIAGFVWDHAREDCGAEGRAVSWTNGNGSILESPPAVPLPLYAVTMNEIGDVVWSACGHEDNYGWLTSDGEWRQLDAIMGPGGPTTANAINEHGQVVGESPALFGGDAPSPIGHATLWEDGAAKDLGALAFAPCSLYPDRNCAYSSATDINENGQVVGRSTAADGFYHAVLWTNGTIRDLWKALPFPGTERGYIDHVLINDAGQIAGSGNGAGFFWSDGTLQEIGSLGGGSTRVVDMNEAGTVVGTSLTASGEQHVFIWTQNGGIVDLGTGPQGFKNAWVLGITYFGDVVGLTAPSCPAMGCSSYSVPGESRGVLWKKPKASASP